MLYALLSTGIASALAIAYLTWTRAAVEVQLANTVKTMQEVANRASGWQTSYDLLMKTTQSKDALIITLRSQNDEYLSAITKSNAPGVFANILQKRNT